MPTLDAHRRCHTRVYTRGTHTRPKSRVPRPRHHEHRCRTLDAHRRCHQGAHRGYAPKTEVACPAPDTANTGAEGVRENPRQQANPQEACCKM
eukprot:13876698-Alexandrium_andersonii.AAC.1